MKVFVFVLELQETMISLRNQLKDITDKHDKEKKKRRQLHNDLMVSGILHMLIFAGLYKYWCLVTFSLKG